MTYTYQKRIYGFECDVYGHLNNAFYLNLLEAARAEALIEMGLPIAKLRELNLQIFVLGFELKYIKAIQLEDVVSVKTSTLSLNRLKARWRQEVYDSNNELCFTAEMDAVFASEGRPQRLPKEALQLFEKGMRSS